MKPIQLEGTTLVALIGVTDVRAIFQQDWFIDASDSVTYQTHTHYFTIVGINEHLTQAPSNQVLSEIAPAFFDRRPPEYGGLKVEVEFFRWDEVNQVNANALAWKHVA
jgi:hypothetical protein